MCRLTVLLMIVGLAWCLVIQVLQVTNKAPSLFSEHWWWCSWDDVLAKGQRHYTHLLRPTIVFSLMELSPLLLFFLSLSLPKLNWCPSSNSNSAAMTPSRFNSIICKLMKVVLSSSCSQSEGKVYPKDSADLAVLFSFHCCSRLLLITSPSDHSTNNSVCLIIMLDFLHTLLTCAQSKHCVHSWKRQMHTATVINGCDWI